MDAVLGFLTRIFATAPDARFVSHEIFRWKYFDARPDWDKPRSYLLQENGSFSAHIGLWPLFFRGSCGQVTGIQSLDWAASPGHSRAGSRIRLAVELMGDFALGIAGTRAAQQVRTKLGFKPWGQMKMFVRVIRPWLKLRQSCAPLSVRKSAGFGRDLVRSLHPFSKPASPWVAEMVSAFDDALDKVLSPAAHTEARAHRSAATLNYLLACPQSNCRAIVLHSRGVIHGYALVSQVEGQARIAALFAPDNWKSAYSLTTRFVAKDPTVHEIVAGVSSASEADALCHCGYRVYDTQPIAIKDPRKVIPPDIRPGLQLADSDAFFL